MPHKLDRFAQQIFDFKSDGESVRSIAAKLTEASGEKIAPSSVQYFLKQESTIDESKTGVQVDQAAVLDALHNVQVHLDEFKTRLKPCGAWKGFALAGIVAWLDFVWAIRLDLSALWKIGLGLVTGVAIGWFLKSWIDRSIDDQKRS